MKKILYIVPLVLIALVSCQKEELLTAESDVVKINAAIGESIVDTRVNSGGSETAAWTIGDKIAVNNEGDTYVDYTYNGTAWTAAHGEFLKWSASTMTFNGYYPVTEGTSLTDFVLPTAQTDVAKISAADYMTVSESKTKPASGYDVSLNFTRKTARVIIKITKVQNEFVGIPVISNFKITSAYAHYSNGTAGGSPTPVDAYKAADDSYVALVIPREIINGDFITLDVTDDTGTKSLKLSTIFGTEAGKSYTHNLTVGKGKIELGSVTVADWIGKEVIPEREAVYKCDDWDGTYATSFASGFGTRESPYLIQTAEELALMSTSVYNQGSPINMAESYYKLMTNVDLKYKDWTPIGSELTNGSFPVGQKSFVGAFDGNGYAVMGLKVTASNEVPYVGLFGQASPFYDDLTIPAIQNITIKDAIIYAGTTVVGDKKEFQGAGILVGSLSGTGDVNMAIRNCHVTGTIYQVDNTIPIYVGGLVGYAQLSKIESCSANVTIDTKASCVGGLLGYVSASSSIKDSRSKGSIKGTWTMGGLAGGAQSSTTINNCMTSVDVTSSDWQVGGFIGYMNATITDCSASGNVTSTANWGNHFYKTGGFVGTNAGTAKNCTYSGTLTYADSSTDSWMYYGAFTGYHDAGFTEKCRFDGSKNPLLDKSGLSWMNPNPILGKNDISNTLE